MKNRTMKRLLSLLLCLSMCLALGLTANAEAPEEEPAQEEPEETILSAEPEGVSGPGQPLGLNYGWAGEINLQCTLDKLFDGAFGGGYPPEEAERKKRDTEALKRIGMITRKSWPEVFDLYDRTLMHKALQWKTVQEDIRKHGKHAELMLLMEHMKRTGEGKGTA